MDEKNMNLDNQENNYDHKLSESSNENQKSEQSTEEAIENAGEILMESELPSDSNSTSSEESTEPKIHPVESAPKPIYQWNYHEQLHADNERQSKNKRNGIFLYASIFAVVFALSIGLLLGSFLFDGRSSQGTAVTGGSIGALYKQCVPSYVAISITKDGGHGTGSGFVMTSDGYIATNYHVVEGAESIKVTMHDDTTYDATFVDGDELNDIAVIKVEAHGLVPAKIGTSKASMVGDQVMAIGTPHSINYRGTMTSGYISALDRRYVEQNDNGTIGRVLHLIQTDTCLNPGNSGGPLFNMNGEVIGVVTLRISGVYEGLGFALPLESVIDIIEDIIQNGKITNPNAGSASHGAALGITGYAVAKDTKYIFDGDYHYAIKTDEKTGEDIVLVPTIYGYVEIPLSDKDQLAYYDIVDYEIYTSEATGIFVVSTSSGFDSADKLKPGDILVSADGIVCNEMDSLKSLIADKKAGDSIEFKVYRDGKIISITVELGKSSEMTE